MTVDRLKRNVLEEKTIRFNYLELSFIIGNYIYVQTIKYKR